MKKILALLLFAGLFYAHTAQAQTPSNLTCGNPQSNYYPYGNHFYICVNGTPLQVDGNGGAAGGGVGSNTVSIAASNSPQKAFANVVCPGTADQNCINAAIVSYCPDSITGVPGCRVVLMDGVFNTTGPIVIDNDDVEVSGPNHCMWGGYNGGWGVVTYPGAIGNGCAQIRATNGGFNLFEIHHINPGGTAPSDTGRHRGWRITKLYFVGFQYGNSFAIQAQGNDDNVMIDDNVIMDTVNGFNLTLDTAIVRDNSIQGISGVGIFNAGLQTRLSHNLIFDTGGLGVYSTATSGHITDNVFGDNSTAIINNGDAGANYSVIANNTIVNPRAGCINWGGTIGTIISNNQCFANYTAMTIPAINITGEVGGVVTGNTIATFSGVTQTQAAIAVDSTSTNELVSANNANGTWSIPPFSNASTSSLAKTNLSAQGQFDSVPLQTIATATTIAPTTTGVINLTGTTAIATITPPAGMGASWGSCITFVPASTVATTTAGNVAAIYALVGGKSYSGCWNGTKWYFTGSGI